MNVIQKQVATLLGASVISAEKLAGDASARVYYRCTLADGGTRIAASYPPHLAYAAECSVLIARLYRGTGLLPDVTRHNSRARILVMEDAGTEHMSSCLETLDAGAARKLYTAVIDKLIAWYVHSRSAGVWRCFRRRFTKEKFLWELMYLLKHIQADIGPDGARHVRSYFVELADSIPFTNPVFCHRDFHTRNIMIHEGHIRFIDFQDARYGPLFYDMASLLSDPYTESVVPLREYLLAYFCVQAARAGVISAKGDITSLYTMTALQRAYKALGTYVSLTASGREGYAEYIPRILATVTELSRGETQAETVCGIITGACR